MDPDGRLSQPVNQPLGNETPQQSFYQKASSYTNSKLDHIQTGLDVIGMTPGIGNIADIANAAISGSRGDWSGMAMNMAAAMPVVGIGVTAGKLGVKAGTEVTQQVAKKDLTYLYQKVGAAGEHLKYGITKNPSTRYTSKELAGGELRLIAKGKRADMLKLERELHGTMPIGPEERQLFYIKQQVEKGLKGPPY